MSAHRPAALSLAAICGVVVIAALIAALGPFRPQITDALGERGEFYSAGLKIFADHPVVGTGLDTYGHHFQAYRPASHALTNNTATTDAVHSVPLGMFSNGGLVLGMAYLAVLVTVFLALGRGVIRAEGDARLAVAGFGGVWLAYQAQALISFDVPPLALLHWLSAGVLVALAAPPRRRTIALPGQPAARRSNRKGKAYGDYAVPASTRVLQGAVGVAALAMLWVALYPLRADLVAASGAPLASSGEIEEAIDLFERAAALNPSEPSYPLLAARGYAAQEDHVAALQAAEEAAQRDPGTVSYALYAAQQARLAERQQEAVRWYQEAVERDPLDPPVLNEAASYLAQVGGLGTAEMLLQRSAELRADAQTFVLLAEARRLQGDQSGARDAAERALALNPESEPAKNLIKQLS